jgi:hypothetical protein
MDGLRRLIEIAGHRLAYYTLSCQPHLLAANKF